MMDNNEKKGDIVEPIVVPTDLQPLPPSKANSVHSGDLHQQQNQQQQQSVVENEKKYETIKTIKMNDGQSNLKSTTMEKPVSIMNSSLNLLSNQEVQHETIESSTQTCIGANAKLGVIQLILSVLLSAFGGLLIARNASLSTMGSGRR
jgi:hypothetical protein